MDLLPTDEQNEIVATVASMARATFAPEVLEALDGTDQIVDPKFWAACGELGWFTLGIPEAQGGIGYSAAEEALVCETLGRTIAPGPYIAQILGAHLAAQAGLTEAAAIGAGELIVGSADQTGPDRWLVQFGEQADWMVCFASDGTLSLTPASELKLLESIPSIDPLTPLSWRSGQPTGSPAGDALGLLATLLVAASQAGIAAATAEQSIEYAKVREQFGQPVGGFQAVKHRCADMATRADAAIEQVRWAALTLAGNKDGAAFSTQAARIIANRAAVDNAQINIQNHGGIGFTWECPAHRYVTRSRIFERMFGDTRYHQDLFLSEPAPQD